MSGVMVSDWEVGGLHGQFSVHQQHAAPSVTSCLKDLVVLGYEAYVLFGESSKIWMNL